jgi:hypothetical protein
MPEAPTILDLVRNGTMSSQMAATLWAAVDARLSWVVAAVPRLAGKSAVVDAMLGLLPPGVPVHRLSGDENEMAHLKRAATGGYLVVGEFSQAPVPTYIWGPPVRRVFDAVAAGYSLVTSLHAPGLQGIFDVICQGNGVTDQDASRIKLVLYIRRFGDGTETFWRRLAEVHEIDRVEGGAPFGRLLHRWTGDDGFEAVEAPRLLQTESGALEARAARLEAMIAAGRTTATDVASMVAECRGQTGA